MSSRLRDDGINFVRRMVNVPRNMLGEFSRAMNQGMNLLGGRTNPHRHNQNLHFQQPLPFPFQDPSNSHPPQHRPAAGQQEYWAFLDSFERQYGAAHPFFYACRFTDALKMARDERKLMFMYIHSQEHLFTRSFCRETLCSEVIVQLLDVNFVCWAGLADRGEGLQMGNALGVSSFPFCAVLAPAAIDNLAVLQQLEGPIAPADLVEILQNTIEEQGPTYGNDRSGQEEKRKEDQRVRHDQDIAYIAALQIDQESLRLEKKSSAEAELFKPSRKQNSTSEHIEVKPAGLGAQTSQEAHSGGGQKAEVTQILVRFPNGERREHGFLCTDKVEAIYGYVDSVAVVGGVNYRLISNFPRKVYDGEDGRRLSIADAGLHPKASLFVELL